MTIICDIKMDPIVSEPHCVKVFDFLIHYKLTVTGVCSGRGIVGWGYGGVGRGSLGGKGRVAQLGGWIEADWVLEQFNLVNVFSECIQ